MKLKLAMFIHQGDGELSIGTMLRQAISSSSSSSGGNKKTKVWQHFKNDNSIANSSKSLS